MKSVNQHRRMFLRYGLAGLGVILSNVLLLPPLAAASLSSRLASQGDLLPPDQNGVRCCQQIELSGFIANKLSALVLVQ